MQPLLVGAMFHKSVGELRPLKKDIGYPMFERSTRSSHPTHEAVVWVDSRKLSSFFILKHLTVLIEKIRRDFILHALQELIFARPFFTGRKNFI